MAHKFDPTHKEHLHDPERRTWQDPDAILGAFGVAPGMVVADVGCGTGYFALPAAARVGPEGRVYAVDMQEEMLWSLQDRLHQEGVRNVLPVLSLEDVIPLPDATADAALLVNALHELRGDGTLGEIWRLLRPGGFLGVVDWKREPMERGPPPDHRLSLGEARNRLEGLGFRPKAVEVGPYHYGFRAERPPEDSPKA